MSLFNRYLSKQNDSYFSFASRPLVSITTVLDFFSENGLYLPEKLNNFQIAIFELVTVCCK